MSGVFTSTPLRIFTFEEKEYHRFSHISYFFLSRTGMLPVTRYSKCSSLTPIANINPERSDINLKSVLTRCVARPVPPVASYLCSVILVI